MLKSSKHRCSCYSQQSGSLLYGLRRDTPSTDRVLHERLLNILSRAAAHKSKNPQRLWAESERPKWWIDVTDLPWKNPREHPKDNKDTLKKKIEILEQQLKARGMMTKELEEELTIHRGSKKIDLELKSDFEAVISKASGLHFMLDKVSSKMGQSRIISDKMATYISETKSCIDKVHGVISAMFEQVQAREERKSGLWASMGVSKQQQQTVTRDDIVVDTFGLDTDLEMMEDLPDELAEIFSSRSEVLSPPFTATLSPPPDESDAVVMRKNYSSPQTHSSMPAESPYESLRISKPVLETLQTRNLEVDLSVPHRRSLSHAERTQTQAEAVHAVDFSTQGRSSVTFPLFTKRNWRQSFEASPEEFDQAPKRVKSPRMTAVEPATKDVIVIEEDDVHSGWRPLDYDTTSDSVSVTSNPVLTTSTLAVGLSSLKQRSSHSQDKPTLSASRRKALHPLTESQSSATTTAPDRVRTPPVATVAAHVTPRKQRTRDPLLGGGIFMSTSTPKVKADVTAYRSLLPSDVEEDAEFISLDDIEEVRETPTASMYAKDTSGMDHLAAMTSALSCEDLSPSVTEKVMTGKLPGPKPARSSAREAASERPPRKQPVGFVSLQTPLTRIETVPREMRTSGLADLGPAESSKYVLMPSDVARVTLRARDVSRKDGDDGNGEKSLSRAIGSLSGDFIH